MKALEIRPAPDGVTKDNMWAVSEYKVPGLYEVEGQLLSFNGVCVTTLGMIGLFPTTGVPELAQIELSVTPPVSALRRRASGPTCAGAATSPRWTGTTMSAPSVARTTTAGGRVTGWSWRNGTSS